MNRQVSKNLKEVVNGYTPTKKINRVNTYSDKYISFNEIDQKSWNDIDVNYYNFYNITKEIGKLGNDNNFDSSIFAMPFTDWIESVFIKLFNILPNKISFMPEMIKTNEFFNDLLKKFKLKNDYYIKSQLEYFNDGLIRSDNEQMLLCLDSFGLILYKNYGALNIFYSPNHYLTSENGDKLKLLVGVLKNYIKPKIQQNHIFIIYNDGRGLTKRSFKLQKKYINLEENYNDDFIDVSKDLINKLNDKNKTGLFILHGEHGTGKTTYIRYLASVVKREIVFVPPDMVDIITSPNFISFLMENPDTVLIIEDGESAIQQRDNARTNGVANILNMTDGLLSDCLNISIVVTFNTNTKNLDDALLRKGRLMKRYEFGKLSQHKSQKLLDKLGVNMKAQGPMRLSDIYYADDNNQTEDFTEKKTVKGFNNK
jgi:hypothetical protein